MNTRTIKTALLIAALPTAALYLSAADSDAPKAEKKQHREIRTIQHVIEHPKEMEKATFLGVAVVPAPEVLSSQLGLAEGMGLVVNHVVEDSPAKGQLQEHDVLLKLDDQVLVDARQLSVLVRSKKEGDEVLITFLRAGKQQTAKIKLIKREVPKRRMMGALMEGLPASIGHYSTVPPGEASQVFSYLSKSRPGSDAQFHVFDSRSTGDAPKAFFLNPGNSKLLFTDDDGSIEMTIKDGKKSIIAKDPSGKEIISGPVDTPEQRKALPEKVRIKLDNIEATDTLKWQQKLDEPQPLDSASFQRSVPGERMQISHSTPSFLL